eukprot:9786023-Heterocapsa_arctica.AAC.1
MHEIFVQLVDVAASVTTMTSSDPSSPVSSSAPSSRLNLLWFAQLDVFLGVVIVFGVFVVVVGLLL